VAAYHKLRSFVWVITAIVGGAIVGAIVGIPTAILLDFAFGEDVTGGRWPLNAANVLLIVSFLGSKPSSSDEERLEPFFSQVYELCNRMSHRFSPSLPHRLGHQVSL
jgi:hypothetical protein